MKQFMCAAMVRKDGWPMADNVLALEQIEANNGQEAEQKFADWLQKEMPQHEVKISSIREIILPENKPNPANAVIFREHRGGAIEAAEFTFYKRAELVDYITKVLARYGKEVTPKMVHDQDYVPDWRIILVDGYGVFGYINKSFVE